MKRRDTIDFPPLEVHINEVGPYPTERRILLSLHLMFVNSILEVRLFPVAHAISHLIPVLHCVRAVVDQGTRPEKSISYVHCQYRDRVMRCTELSNRFG